MVSSTLNPQAITKKSPASLDSFGNFMTGGSLSSSSSVATAANKIVSFNRQEVSPISSNISSLISNISTNILNQVDNSIRNTTNLLKDDTENNINKLRNDLYSRITELQSNLNNLQKDVSTTSTEIQTQIASPSQSQSQTSVSGLGEIIKNIQNQVQNVLDNTLRNFSQDYQQKIKGFDDARPNNVLTKFLDLYRNAIGFVNFFGDRKNIKTIENNLKALRKIFEESFEVAAVLRQTIVKIVNQLSNLPTASPNSGGLNLDIDVPGGRLRQAGGPSVRNVGRAAKFGGIAGAGLLGLGGAAAAVSGMGRAKEYQESLLSEGVSPVSGEQYIPENIVESFSAIVDRFVSAVNGLISGAKKTSGITGGSSAGSSPSGGPTSGKVGPTGTGGVSSDVTSAVSDPNVKAFLDVLAKPESGGRYDVSVGGKIFKDMSKHPEMYNPELGSDAAGRYQFISTTFKPIAEKLGLKDFSPESQDLAAVQYLKDLGVLDEIMSGDPAKLEDVKRRLQKSTWTGLRKYDSSSYLKYFQERQKYYKNSGGMTTPVKAMGAKPTDKIVEEKAKVSPTSTQTQAIQARAQLISQPAQQVPQTISLPPTVIDASGGGQQQGGGVQAIPSQPPGPGPEVPFLPTTNPDNFLTMYSRIVYNIVDG